MEWQWYMEILLIYQKEINIYMSILVHIITSWLIYYVNPLRFKAREYTLREFQRASKL